MRREGIVRIFTQQKCYHFKSIQGLSARFLASASVSEAGMNPTAAPKEFDEIVASCQQIECSSMQPPKPFTGACTPECMSLSGHWPL